MESKQMRENGDLLQLKAVSAEKLVPDKNPQLSTLTIFQLKLITICLH